MLLVQRLLRGGTSPEELLVKHGVKMRSYNGKVSLNYDMLLAADSDEVARQCRGVVLRQGSWDLLAYPFDRFFNWGQGAAATIDWSSATFQEKLDGTMVVAYWDGLRWCVATRNMCEAQGDINGLGRTFRDLVEECCSDMGSSLQKLLAPVPKHYTVIFELTGPENQIVCLYQSVSLTLLGVRDIQTLQELDPKQVAKVIGIPTVKEWPFSDVEEFIKVSADWSCNNHEGVVIRDKFFNRIKVKTSAYTNAHRIISSVSSSVANLIETIISGKSDDLEPILPPYILDKLNEVKRALAGLSSETLKDWEELKDIDNIKEFAEYAKLRRWSAALFALKRKKTPSLEVFMASQHPKTLESLL